MTSIKEPESIKKLIKLVKNQPLIYNYKLKKRNDKEIVGCWKKIAEEMKFPALDCKSKWTILKTTYRRCIVSRQSTQWKYAKDMSFLNEYCRFRKIYKDRASIEDENVILLSEEEDESMQSNVTDDALHEESKIQDKKSSKEKIITAIINWENNNDISSSNQKFIKTDTSLTDYEYSEQISNKTDRAVCLEPHLNVVNEPHNNIDEEEYLQSATACTSSTNSLQVTSQPKQTFQNYVESFIDEDMNFLQSLHSDMKKLNNNRKRRFKLQVITALYKFLDEEEANCN